jgi:hypothetical protein
MRGAVAAAVLPVTVLASVILGGSARAPDAGVTCGSTITTDVTLTADLSCPSGDGIILGSGVTLDLGRHRLAGTGIGVGVQAAILSEGGNTVRNGTIENWGNGIRFAEESVHGVPYTVSDVVLLHAPVVHFLGYTTLEMSGVTAVDSWIDGQMAGDIAISASTLTRSPVSVFYADAVITDSTLVQSTLYTTTVGGIVVDSSTLDGKGSGAAGSMNDSTLTIRNSIVKDFAQPITGYRSGVNLTNNTFTDMRNGVLGDLSSGLWPDGASLIVGNTFVRSGVALRGNVPMVVENNTFKQGAFGVVFTRPEPMDGQPAPTAEGSRAVGNVFSKNSGSGIQTDLPGLSVGANTAERNGGYGIYAPGAIDLGGNVASHNALGQCVGVLCTVK